MISLFCAQGEQTVSHINSSVTEQDLLYCLFRIPVDLQEEANAHNSFAGA